MGGARLRFFLFSILLLPSSLHFVGFGSSYALGVSFCAILLLLFHLVSGTAAISRRNAAIVAVAATAVGYHLIVVAWLSPQEAFWLGKALSSLVLLSGLAIATGVAARQANFVNEIDFDRLVRRAAIFLLLIGMASFFLSDVARQYFGHNVPIPPFSEPSHFVLAIAPFALYGVLRRDIAVTALFVVVSVMFVIGVRSATFVALIALIASTSLRYRYLCMILIVGVVAITAFDTQYYTDRIFFQNSNNLSALVYRQGFEIIAGGISRGMLIGSGFQQLGAVDLGLESSALIRKMLDADLNTLDGGFVAAKIFGEFGILAVVPALLLVYSLVRSFFALRAYTEKRLALSPQYLFANSCILTYAMEFFVRGMGYFSIGGTLLLFSLFLIYTPSSVAREEGKSVTFGE